MAVNNVNGSSYNYAQVIQSNANRKRIEIQDQNTQLNNNVTNNQQSNTINNDKRVNEPASSNNQINSYQSAYEELRSSNSKNESLAVQAYASVQGQSRRSELESMFGLSIYA